MKIREIAEKLFLELGQQDIVAGSREERESLEKIRGIFEELQLPVETYSFQCSSWREKHVSLHLHDHELKAVAMPNSPSGSVEAKAVYVGERILREEFRGLDLTGKIAVVKMYRKIDEISWQYLRAVERGAEAVIFVDPYPDRRRRIVIVPSVDYTFSVGSPPPVPVASVSLEDGLKLVQAANRGEKISLEIETDANNSATTGVVAAGNLEGPIFTAHIDKWLSGFTDNVLGVGIVLALAEKYRENAGFIVFGSEEFGAPGYSPWYWIWGSRSFVSRLNERDRLSELGLIINFDTLGGQNISLSASGVDLLSGLRKILGDSYRYTPDQVIFDSFSFTMHGHPALTIHTFEDTLPIYHTDKDVPGNVNWQKIEEAVQLAEIIATHYMKNKWKMLDYTVLIDKVTEKAMKLKDIKEASELIDFLEKIKIENEKQAHYIRRELTRPIYAGTYGEVFEDPVVSYPYLLEAIEDLLSLTQSPLDNTTGESKLKALVKTVPGWETKIYDLRILVNKNAGEELRYLARQLATAYLAETRKIFEKVASVAL